MTTWGQGTRRSQWGHRTLHEGQLCVITITTLSRRFAVDVFLKLMVFLRAECVYAYENMVKQNIIKYLKMVHTLSVYFGIDQDLCTSQSGFQGFGYNRSHLINTNCTLLVTYDVKKGWPFNTPKVALSFCHLSEDLHNRSEWKRSGDQWEHEKLL